MPKPRVLFYHAHFFQASETFIYQQAINPWIEPVLVAKHFSGPSGLSVQGFAQHAFRRTGWDGLAGNILLLAGIDRYYQPASARALATLIEAQQPDVIHAQFGFNAVRLLPVVQRLRLPLVVSFHGMDASKMLRSRAYRKGLEEVFAHASRIVVCQPAMAEVLPLTDRQKQRVRWIPYGIDLHRFAPEPRTQGPVARLLHVGRLVHKKGVADLVRAFARLSSPAELHLVGTGPEEPRCRQLAQQLQLGDRIIFHGWKTPADVKALMQQADVFVLNCRTASNGDQEGLPVGILEAMAMALPVVSTRHAGVPLQVQEGVTGTLVAERDTEALAMALDHLVTDAGLREAMGKAGRLRAESIFSMPQMHQALAAVYREAMEEHTTAT
ncbi:MAG: glycosyltransferase [Cyclobacteriaceae bacterium]|jgi:glycosyltransferase involved in cell wall biosynthesis|nr:glycosyltransferase [Cyclobacteriaceae bacterium]